MRVLSPAVTATVFSPSSVNSSVKLVIAESFQFGESFLPLNSAAISTVLPFSSLAVTKKVFLALFITAPSVRVLVTVTPISPSADVVKAGTTLTISSAAVKSSTKLRFNFFNIFICSFFPCFK